MEVRRRAALLDKVAAQPWLHSMPSTGRAELRRCAAWAMLTTMLQLLWGFSFPRGFSRAAKKQRDSVGARAGQSVCCAAVRTQRRGGDCADSFRRVAMGTLFEESPKGVTSASSAGRLRRPGASVGRAPPSAGIRRDSDGGTARMAERRGNGDSIPPSSFRESKKKRFLFGPHSD